MAKLDVTGGAAHFMLLAWHDQQLPLVVLLPLCVCVQEKYVFPIHLGVTQLSGTGADSIFLGVAKAMPVRVSFPVECEMHSSQGDPVECEMHSSQGEERRVPRKQVAAGRGCICLWRVCFAPLLISDLLALA